MLIFCLNFIANNRKTQKKVQWRTKKGKSGHFRSWSFSVIFKMSWVILSYSKYKYYLYYTIDDLFSPETKMTGNDHDRK